MTPRSSLGRTVQCPKCKGYHVIKNGKDKEDSTIQVYKCRECGYIWSDKPLKQYYKNPEQIECHKCGSIEIRKEGKTVDGRQRYKCKCCGYKFTDNLKYANDFVKPRELTQKDKNLILMYHIHLKQSIKALAKSFNKPVEDVRLLVKAYKESHPEMFTSNGKLKKMA